MPGTKQFWIWCTIQISFRNYLVIKKVRVWKYFNWKKKYVLFYSITITFLCFQFCVSWAVRGFITCPTSVQQKWKLKYLHFYIFLHNAFNRETKTFPQVSKLTLFPQCPRFPRLAQLKLMVLSKIHFAPQGSFFFLCTVEESGYIIQILNLSRKKTQFSDRNM